MLGMHAAPQRTCRNGGALGVHCQTAAPANSRAAQVHLERGLERGRHQAPLLLQRCMTLRRLNICVAHSLPRVVIVLLLAMVRWTIHCIQML